MISIQFILPTLPGIHFYGKSLGEDPQAAISKLVTDSFDSSSALARHADMVRAFASVPDLSVACICYGVLRLIPES